MKAWYQFLNSEVGEEYLAPLLSSSLVTFWSLHHQIALHLEPKQSMNLLELQAHHPIELLTHLA